MNDHVNNKPGKDAMRFSNNFIHLQKTIFAFCLSIMLTGCGADSTDIEDQTTVAEIHIVISDVMETQPTRNTEITTTSERYIATTVSSDPAVFNTDDAIAESTISDDITINIVDYDETYADKGSKLLSVSADIISFASDVPIEKESITEIHTDVEFKNFISERNSLWDDDMSGYIIRMSSDSFRYEHKWHPVYSYTGQSNLRYFLIESNYFDPYHFANIDGNNARYDKTTNTVYIPLVTDMLYSDLISDATIADNINQASKSSYCMFVINAGDYSERTSIDNPLNIVLVTPPHDV